MAITLKPCIPATMRDAEEVEEAIHVCHELDVYLTHKGIEGEALEIIPW